MQCNIHRALKLTVLVGLLSSIYALAADQSTCFKYYRDGGAIPGRDSCPGLAYGSGPSDDDDNALASYNCYGNYAINVTIPRYCGEIDRYAGNSCGMMTSNPINAITGNKYFEEEDFRGPGSVPLSFARHFNSKIVPYSRDIGEGWRHSYSSSLHLDRAETTNGSSKYVMGSSMSVLMVDGSIFGLIADGNRFFDKDAAGKVRTGLSAMNLTGSRGSNYFLVTDAKKRRMSIFDANSPIPGNGLNNIGKLSEVWDASGRWQKINRDSKGAIDSVVDMLSGRALNFSYFIGQGGVPVAIRSVTLPNGKSITYEYEPAPTTSDVPGLSYRLKRVNRPHSTALPESQRTYLYDEPEFAATIDTSYVVALTGIQDIGFSRLVTVRYGAQAWEEGRAYASELGNGLVKTEISYQQSAATALMKTQQSCNSDQTSCRTEPRQLDSYVKRKDGPEGWLSYIWSSDGLGFYQSTSPAGAGCAESYTKAGPNNLIDFGKSTPEWQIDSNGNQVCRSYADIGGRLMETVRIEGLSKTVDCLPQLAASQMDSGARKISTRWHPAWDIKVATAEPGRIITHVYNGQPDPDNNNATLWCAPTSALLPDGKPIAVLCKTTEEETTDLTGVSGFSAVKASPPQRRTTVYGYNSWGQMTSKDGPRAGLIDRENWDYYSTPLAGAYSAGDLKAYTDAVGKITKYLKYNETGSPLEIEDANGIVSKFEYDFLNRVIASVVGGERTEYFYDAAGRLERAKEADGVEYKFDYDAAYRLYKISDPVGNFVQYTLDGMGNRKSEVIADRNGQVRASIIQAIDALGRVANLSGGGQ